ncbi:hypothetical protein GCM10008013_41420 [Paenibacillus segetis]|uniref:Carotenoid biosynthesis protein n=2 Tax=Paenibacillus segetis TaxID=1325360 RepID=A0ABQ1YR29_9BACL|nr:hypothetical protein GCM10008013_41420 [Paenibacillus segetis]
MLTAGIFENIGVFAGTYYYSLDRVMMFGKVPLSILFIEGAIFYVSMILVEHLKLPKWAIPLGVGVLASIQDLTLDPTSVFDLHIINGVSEGQWNWTKYYEGGYVNIPFSNFSGWLTMMVFFAAAVAIGRNWYNRSHKNWVAVAYPLISIVVTVLLLITPINQFLLFGVPFASMNSKIAELVMLCFNYSISLFILIRFAKHNKAIERKDALMITIPVFLDLYALVNAIIMGITEAILPIVIVSIIHCTYLIWIYKKGQNTLSKQVNPN